MTDTARLRALLADGGSEWHAVKEHHDHHVLSIRSEDDGLIAEFVYPGDAALIVEAVNALPGLLDELDALRAALNSLAVAPELRERMQRYETGRATNPDDGWYIAATDRTVLIEQIDRALRAALAALDGAR